MWKKVLGGLVVVVAVLVGAVSMRPGTFRVARERTLNAPASVVFAQVNDFQRWAAWSPWIAMDPATTVTISTPSSGPGATYTYASDKTGAGIITIEGSDEPARVVLDMHFTKPFDAHNTTTFTLDGQGTSTHVTWAMEGPTNFFSKLMGLFVDMDGMIGPDFDKGLANLDRVVLEQAAAMPAAAPTAPTPAVEPTPTPPPAATTTPPAATTTPAAPTTPPPAAATGSGW